MQSPICQCALLWAGLPQADAMRCTAVVPEHARCQHMLAAKLQIPSNSHNSNPLSYKLWYLFQSFCIAQCRSFIHVRIWCDPSQKPRYSRSLRVPRGRRAGSDRASSPRLLPPEEAELAGMACSPLVTVGVLLRGQVSLSSFAQGKVAGTPVFIAAAWWLQK